MAWFPDRYSTAGWHLRFPIACGFRSSWSSAAVRIRSMPWWVAIWWGRHGSVWTRRVARPGQQVAWTVEMRQPAMRLASRFGRPLLQWGHDRVVEMTVAGFRRRIDDVLTGAGHGDGGGEQYDGP